MSSLNSYWIPVLALGFGLAIDLFIATLSRFHDSTIGNKNWALPLAGTHSLLPALSFIIFWFVGNQSDDPQLLLGLSGFVLITIVVQEIFLEALGRDPIVDLSGFLGWLFRIERITSQRLMLVLSVSWDAFGCGSIVVAQAEAGQWSLIAIVMAFLIYGLFAGIVAMIAINQCVKWRRSNFHDVNSLTKLNFWGVFATISVIGGFGVMSLWFAFDKEANVYVSILITTTISSLIFILLREPLWQEAQQEALETIGD